MTQADTIQAAAENYYSLKDESSYNVLYNLIQKPLEMYVYRNYLKAISEARDAVADTSIIIWNKIHLYNNEWRFTTWMYTIARNVSLAKIKDKKRLKYKTHFDSVDDDRYFEDVSYEDGFVEEHLKVDLDEIIEKQLDETEYDMFVDRYFNGLSERDLVNKYERPLGSIKTIVRRGRRKITAYINDEPFYYKDRPKVYKPIVKRVVKNPTHKVPWNKGLTKQQMEEYKNNIRK